jgi:hypothetical protein
MSAAQRVFILVLAACAVAVVGWRCVAWRAAAAEFERARGFHAEVTSKAARLAALRAQPAVSGFGTRPDQDVIQLVNGVLDRAGLPAGRLRSVQPEPDRAVVDDRDGRRAATVRLALEPVTVQELGSLLAAWRNGQQVWSVARIDLSAMTGGGGGAGRASGQYRASIIVTATYVDEAAPLPAAPSGAAVSSPLVGATP